jgi:hypothetical protein
VCNNHCEQQKDDTCGFHVTLSRSNENKLSDR